MSCVGDAKLARTKTANKRVLRWKSAAGPSLVILVSLVARRSRRDWVKKHAELNTFKMVGRTAFKTAGRKSFEDSAGWLFRMTGGRTFKTAGRQGKPHHTPRMMMIRPKLARGREKMKKRGE